MIEPLPAQNVQPKYDIIWNITRLCAWDCSVCCVDAIQIDLKSKNTMAIRWDGLKKSKEIQRLEGQNDIKIVAAHLPSHLKELGLKEKLGILQNLRGECVKIDISGGDPLIITENLEVLRAASEILGRENVTLTMTGRAIRHKRVKGLADYIGEYNFSVDGNSIFEGSERPNGYVKSNIAIAKEFARSGVNTRAELVLTSTFLSKEKLYKLLVSLKKASTRRLLLMREFFVGRNAPNSYDLTADQIRKIIESAREIQKEIGFPEIQLQCALKHLEKNSVVSSTNPCDLLTRSFGILPDGRLILSPWAIKRGSLPISDDWVVGDLTKTSLTDILNSSRVIKLKNNIDKNFGHCKIFAFQNSQKLSFSEKLLDATDPLYIAPPKSSENYLVVAK